MWGKPTTGNFEKSIFASSVDFPSTDISNLSLSKVALQIANERNGLNKPFLFLIFKHILYGFELHSDLTKPTKFFLF